MTVVDGDLLRLAVEERWERVFSGLSRERIEAGLPTFLNRHRWFGGKGRLVNGTRIVDVVPIFAGPHAAVLTFIEVVYRDGPRETYVLPVTAAFEEQAERLAGERPQAVMAEVSVTTRTGTTRGFLYDAAWNEGFAQGLLGLIKEQGRCAGAEGRLEASCTGAFEAIVGPGGPSRVLGAEQSNTAIVFGDRAILKLYRRVQPGINPDLEIGRYLTGAGFPHTAPVAGALEYRRVGAEPTTIALLQGFIPNQGDGWTYMLGEIDAARSRLLSQASEALHATGATEWRDGEILGRTAQAIACLGQRTAELHRVLALAKEAELAPEPMTRAYCDGRLQSMGRLWSDARQLLVQRRPVLSESVRRQADEVLGQEAAILKTFEALRVSPGAGRRIRCHGDYHLGQVLWTGSDFAIIDFEGEPARPLAERRMKHSPLYDVAGMLRSFDYASHAGWARQAESGAHNSLRHRWSRSAQRAFLRAYERHTEGAEGWPTRAEAAVLLTVHLLEKAVYELGYELNNRPDWAGIPLAGMLDLLAVGAAGTGKP